MSKNYARKRQVDKRQVVIGYGSRAVNDQNFSKMIVLPKGALANCGANIKKIGCAVG